ncbi:MAG: glycosyltransferase family protein [Hyphomicrobiales bacterium]|nr:glycosyltransferase family protein [Hyphomicrobiales bacterium]
MANLTAAIVQARHNSTRLPGKVLADLAGRPVIAHVIERALRIPGVDVVVCAVPDQPESRQIEAYAKGAGAKTFRGSEQDVLARTLGAARSAGADIVVRVTSDCPLIDPAVCGDVVALRAAEDVDYASNVDPRSFPAGLDCEVFTVEALAVASMLADEPYEREHVTTRVKREAGTRRANLTSPDRTLAGKRWTLDWPEDLEFLRAVHAHGEPESMQAVLDILRANPEIEAINAMRKAA